MSDNLVIGGATFNNVAGIKATDSNNTVQTFLNATPVVVPSGYTQLAYIETDGNSLIDTGITWGANKKIEFSWAQDGSVARANYKHPFGSNSCFVQIKNTNFGGGAYIKINDSNYFATSDAGFPETPHTLIVTPNSIEAKGYIVDTPPGTLVTQTGSVTAVGVTIAIGGRHNSSGYDGLRAGTIIYRWKMYDNNQLVQDLVPARRDSDDVLGMYDIVNNNFLTNAGSGSFTGGAL